VQGLLQGAPLAQVQPGPLQVQPGLVPDVAAAVAAAATSSSPASSITQHAAGVIVFPFSTTLLWEAMLLP